MLLVNPFLDLFPSTYCATRALYGTKSLNVFGIGVSLYFRSAMIYSTFLFLCGVWATPAIMNNYAHQVQRFQWCTIWLLCFDQRIN